MNDMRHVIVPKSDQLNSDDLIAGPITIQVREVTIRGGQEQPVSIHFANDGGKPYKPCKSMSRVLVAAWGADANKYVGRSLTLYRDPSVKWAGMEVGGIRISHMSHIDRDMVMALTATKGSRKPFKVQPLKDAAKTEAPKPADPAASADQGNGQTGQQQADDKQTDQKPEETIGFTTWDGNQQEFPRNLAGIEKYVESFEPAFQAAVDKAAWFADNEALFHELSLGAVSNRGKSPRMEKLAARFDAVANMIEDTLAGKRE